MRIPLSLSTLAIEQGADVINLGIAKDDPAFDKKITRKSLSTKRRMSLFHQPGSAWVRLIMSRALSNRKDRWTFGRSTCVRVNRLRLGSTVGYPFLAFREILSQHSLGSWCSSFQPSKNYLGCSQTKGQPTQGPTGRGHKI